MEPNTSVSSWEYLEDFVENRIAEGRYEKSGRSGRIEVFGRGRKPDCSIIQAAIQKEIILTIRVIP